MTWFEIKLSAPEELREAITNRLLELGAEGVYDEKDLHAYFDESQRSSVAEGLQSYLVSLAELHPKLAAVTYQTLQVPTQNWAETHKSFYRAQRLSKSFFLRPAWDVDSPVPPELVPIVMEPGQAFGTGLHPSTRLCMRLLEHVANGYPKPQETRVLDVGTGTGILAIVARKLGFGQVIAVDNDPVAVETAIANVKLNQCEDIQVSLDPLSSFSPPFDLILSNILLETHRELAKEYRRLLRPGGELILSGLLAHQRGEVDEIMSEVGFVREISETFQEWTALVYLWHEETESR